MESPHSPQKRHQGNGKVNNPNAFQRKGNRTEGFIFANADTFTEDKINELKTRISLMKEKPALISIQEAKPKHFKIPRQKQEYEIEGWPKIF